jgi:hypothetical protein
MAKTNLQTTTKDGKDELAALATLLGVMSTAARLSEQLLELSDKHIGESVDTLMAKAGLRIEDLEDHLRAPRKPTRKRKGVTRARKTS